MILYHATPIKNGLIILQDKKIKCNIERYHKTSRIVDGTTNGYVYLTQNLSLAYFFAAIKFGELKESKERYICIFKIEIGDTSLEPDYDELRIKKIPFTSNNLTYQQSLAACDCVRINKDISLIGMQYIILPSTMNKIENSADVFLCRELCNQKNNDMDNRSKLEKEILKKWTWKSIN